MGQCQEVRQRNREIYGKCDAASMDVTFDGLLAGDEKGYENKEGTQPGRNSTNWETFTWGY